MQSSFSTTGFTRSLSVSKTDFFGQPIICDIKVTARLWHYFSVALPFPLSFDPIIFELRVSKFSVENLWLETLK